jgi:hypothetical protein
MRRNQDTVLTKENQKEIWIQTLKNNLKGVEYTREKLEELFQNNYTIEQAVDILFGSKTETPVITTRKFR